MDSKFIITRLHRRLRSGDIFAWRANSPFIRRFESYDGTTLFFTDIRYYNRDVNISCSACSPNPVGFICKPR